MLARAQYEQEMKEADEAGDEDEEGEGLEMYDGEVEVEEENEDVSSLSAGTKGKGKRKATHIDDDAVTPAAQPSTASKRRRPPVDVFAGPSAPITHPPAVHDSIC